jgi:hemerythrin-like domain-containing protein
MAPQKAQIVERLRREHAEIARGLNKVVMDVEAVRHGDDRSVLDIQRETTAILSLLVAHEAAEETLIQETYLQDKGE